MLLVFSAVGVLFDSFVAPVSEPKLEHQRVTLRTFTQSLHRTRYVDAILIGTSRGYPTYRGAGALVGRVMAMIAQGR